MAFKKVSWFVFCIVLSGLFACSMQPGGGSSSSSGGGDSNPYNITIVSSSTTIPSSYKMNDGTSVTFSAVFKNNGKEIDSSKRIVLLPYVTNVSGQSYNSLMNGSPYYQGCYMKDTVITNGKSWQLTMPSATDISKKGTSGANYFYIVFVIVDSSSKPVSESDTSDNVLQLNSTPVTVTP